MNKTRMFLCMVIITCLCPSWVSAMISSSSYTVTSESCVLSSSAKTSFSYRVYSVTGLTGNTVLESSAYRLFQGFFWAFISSVVAIFPEDGSFILPEDIASLWIKFSDSMSFESLESGVKLQVEQSGISPDKNGTYVSGTYSYEVVDSSAVLRFTPSSELDTLTRYRFLMSGVCDANGRFIDDREWSFGTMTDVSSEARAFDIQEKTSIRIAGGSLPEPGFIEVKKVEKTAESVINANLEVEDSDMLSQADTIYEFSAINAQNDQITSLNSPADLYFSFEEEDGMLKGTNICVEYLRLFRLNEDRNRWVMIDNASFQKGGVSANSLPGAEYTVQALSNRFGTYALLGYGQPEGMIYDLFNYPNPFHAGQEDTTIAFRLDPGYTEGNVRIAVYSLMGNVVIRFDKTLSELEKGDAGLYLVRWDGKNDRGKIVSNGGYIARVEFESGGARKHLIRKIAVLK